MPLEEALVLLAEAEEEHAEAEAEFRAVMEKLGFTGWQRRALIFISAIRQAYNSGFEDLTDRNPVNPTIRCHIWSK